MHPQLEAGVHRKVSLHPTVTPWLGCIVASSSGSQRTGSKQHQPLEPQGYKHFTRFPALSNFLKDGMEAEHACDTQRFDDSHHTWSEENRITDVAHLSRQKVNSFRTPSLVDGASCCAMAAGGSRPNSGLMTNFARAARSAMGDERQCRLFGEGNVPRPATSRRAGGRILLAIGRRRGDSTVIGAGRPNRCSTLLGVNPCMGCLSPLGHEQGDLLTERYTAISARCGARSSRRSGKRPRLRQRPLWNP